MAEQFNYSSVLAPYINRLLEMKTTAGYSAHRLKWILKEFDDFAKSVKLTIPCVTEEFIAQWRKRRNADSERTIYAKYSAWHMLTTMMSRCGLSCFIPRLPKQPKVVFTAYVFTEQQVGKIFEVADNMRLYDIRMGTALIAIPAILRLLYSTGLRVSEALSLKNCNIDLQTGCLMVRKTKNGSERIVALSSSMKTVLADYLYNRDRMPVADVSNPDNPVFIKSDGTTLATGTVYVNFRKILDKCGIKHGGRALGPCVHSLRHTSACHALSQMAQGGMDIYTALPILSASLGHHSLSATEQYVRLTQAMFPELSGQCSQINAFVHPKRCPAYDYND